MALWCAALAVLLLTTVNGQQPPQQSSDAVSGEVLLKFDPRASSVQRNAILNSRNIRPIRRFDALDIDYVRVPPGLSGRGGIQALQRLPGIQLAQPNYVRHAIQSAPPNDPYWLDGSLWGLSKIQAQQAWTSFSPGDGSVVIANIDTGIDYTHPDLAANMWRNPFEIAGNGLDDDGNGYIDDIFGIDAVNRDSNPYDDQGHGTHTAGTAAAAGNNGEGVVGVNWNAKLLSCKFLDASGYGTDAGAIECFNYIVAMKNRGVNIRVSSNSWGEPRSSGPPAVVLQAAIDAAGEAGIINVFGAGNDGTDNDTAPFDPASYPSPSIVAVASSGPTDRRSSFSNYGATSVDLAAPGEDILSTYPGSFYLALSGTSMATPHVAGAAALLAHLDPTLSVPAIKSLLLDNVDQSQRWAGRVVSGGRLNLYKAASAIDNIQNNTPPVVSITAPGAGATFKAPATIVVDASASDSDGTIQRVSFFANGALIGTDTDAPYSVVWTGAPAGTYALTAVATDDRWGTGTSAAVSVTLLPNAPPVVSVTSPADGASFTVPVDVIIEASASDSDGSIQQVEFFANGVSIGADIASPFGIVWTPALGIYSITAVATDNEGATGTSAPIRVTINAIPNRVNVALAANGSLATASSTLSASYPPSATINGDRKGLNWGSGGGWNDGTPNATPDWLQVDFNGLKLIEEIDVFSLQDNYSSPSEPTPTMTFTSWGLRGFEVQYWTGDGWATVPNGVVANNNLVWRQIVFAPLTTTKIRVYITAALNGYSRMVEVEAWGVKSGQNDPPGVAIASPSDGASFVAPANLTINATATDTDGVVQRVDFYANDLAIGSAASSPYSIAWANVASGSYTLTAVATDNDGATTTSSPVQITVAAANSAPSVSISSPTEGAAFTAPATISIEAAASDADGTLQQVAFYANGALLGADATSPYSVTWSGVAAGNYVLTAIATDNVGAATTSAPVQIVVGQPPGRINMALSSNGGLASASSTLSANYPPSGAINGDRKGLNWGNGGGWNDGTPNAMPDWLEVTFAGTKLIDEVDVFSMQDNYSSPVEPTPTMTFTTWGLRAFEIQYWDGAAWVAIPGASITNNNLVWRQFVLSSPVLTTKIRLYITAALNGYSRVIELEAWGVSAGGNAPPSVSLTSPAGGATFIAPANLTLSATASDSDGLVTSVAFYANGSPIGSTTTSPYTIAWNNVPAGAYTLTAVATDNQGETTTSDGVAITVANNVPPSVSLTSPAAGATFTAPALITVSAAAADPDGSIASVAFYADGAPIGSDTTSPYSVDWSNVPAGTYLLTAVATDNLGSATTSAAVQVTVDNAPSRVNVALAANGAVASASSTLNANYPPAGAINGDRKGLNWGSGGGWNDGTVNTMPDWIEVDFNGPKTIDEVSVFSMQDNYTSPSEPTPTMTFTSWGLRAFEVQYWTGSAWATIPGASITNNNLVWRRFLIAPVTTTKIRVYVTAALNGYSRVIEVEAWGTAAAQGPEPN